MKEKQDWWNTYKGFHLFFYFSLICFQGREFGLVKMHKFPKPPPALFVHIQQILRFRRKKQKFLKKPIDNGKKMCYNNRAIGRKPNAQRQKILYIKEGKKQ